MKRAWLWVISSTALALAACAPSPTKPDTGGSGAPAAPAAIAAAPGPSDQSQALDPAAAHANVIRQAREQGYKPRKTNGDTVYCRSEAVIGSRLEKVVCLTEESLAQVLRNTEDAQQALMRGNTCAGAGCGGN